MGVVTTVILRISFPRSLHSWEELRDSLPLLLYAGVPNKADSPDVKYEHTLPDICSHWFYFRILQFTSRNTSTDSKQLLNVHRSQCGRNATEAFVFSADKNGSLDGQEVLAFLGRIGKST